MEGNQTHSNLPRSAEVMSVGWGRWAQSVDSLGVIASLSHILEATRREHRDTRYSWGSPMSWPDMNRSMYLDYAMACMDLNRLEISPHHSPDCCVDCLCWQLQLRSLLRCPLHKLPPLPQLRRPERYWADLPLSVLNPAEDLSRVLCSLVSLMKHALSDFKFFSVPSEKE